MGIHILRISLTLLFLIFLPFPLLPTFTNPTRLILSSTRPPPPHTIPPSLPQFEIRQLRAHLAQQDLDLAAEREAAMQIHHVWGKQSSSFQEATGLGPGGPEHHGQAKAREARVNAGKHTNTHSNPSLVQIVTSLPSS